MTTENEFDDHGQGRLDFSDGPEIRLSLARNQRGWKRKNASALLVVNGELDIVVRLAPGQREDLVFD